LLQIAREGEDAVANHELIRNPYNFAHEMDRKRHLAIGWRNSTGIENPEDARVLEARALGASLHLLSFMPDFTDSLFVSASLPNSISVAPLTSFFLQEAAAIEARQAAESKAARVSVIEKQNRSDAAIAATSVMRPEAPAAEGFPSFFSAQGVPIKLVPVPSPPSSSFLFRPSFYILSFHWCLLYLYLRT
jgi:hypothetical protein